MKLKTPPARPQGISMQGRFLLDSLANPVAPTVGALSQTTGNIAHYPFILRDLANIFCYVFQDYVREMKYPGRTSQKGEMLFALAISTVMIVSIALSGWTESPNLA